MKEFQILFWFFILPLVLCIIFLHPDECIHRESFSSGNSTLGASGTYCTQFKQLPSKWHEWTK